MSPQALPPPNHRCPRCAGDFRCGMNDAGPCACSSVALDAPTLARLRQRYTGCLCLDCLRALAAGGVAGPETATFQRPD